MSVLLPDPLEPTSAVVVPAGARKLTFFSTGTPGVVFEADVVELDLALEHAERRQQVVVGVLGPGLHQLADAIEAGKRLADLRAD